METTPNKKNFLKLVTESDSKLLEKLEWRKANEGWLKKSAAIAVKVLRTIRAKGSSQKQLAEQMGVTPQQISKIVQGTANLSLQTIYNLEVALGIELIATETKSIATTKDYVGVNIEKHRLKHTYTAKNDFKTLHTNSKINNATKVMDFIQFAMAS